MKTLTLSILALAELAAFSGVANAQSSVSSAADVPEKIEEVTVTGSHIRGHESPASQVFAITSKDIEDQGLLSIDDVFRSIPSATGSSSAQAMNVNTLAPSGSLGNSSVNLGGFGASSTLVLINGRRTASSSILFGDEVNVSTIPTSAIERIEILPTAAAAIYGADAVGGVVNIILKKRTAFEANTRVNYENSSTGGNATQVSQDLSFGWGSGRFTGVGSYRKSDPVTASSLGLTTLDFRNRGGYDLRAGSGFGQTGTIAGFGSLPPGNPGTAFTPADVSPANFAPASQIYADYIPTMKTTSAYINAEQDVGSAVRLFVDGLYSKNDASDYEYPLNIYGAQVPASNAFNPYGQPVYVTYQFARERDSGLIPSTYRAANEKLWQATFGADISLPHDWHLTAYGTQSNEASFATFTWVTNSNPAVISALADSNPQTALNLFGNGTAQNPATLRSIVSYWMGMPDVEIDSKMTEFSAQADGTLFDLPTGAVKGSFVVEHRRDQLDWGGFGPGSPQGSRTADAVGAEFAVPLLGPDFAQRLDLTLATRWDRYTADVSSGAGTNVNVPAFSATSPMVGLAWKPIPDLKLRASWNKAFRAPVVHDLVGLPYPGQMPVLDPLAPGGPKLVTVNYTWPASEQLGPETAKVWTTGIDWQHLDASGAGLSASLTYSHTDFTNRIVGAYTYFFQDPSYFVSHPEIFPDATARDANGNLTNVYLRNINIGSEKSRLWTLDSTYVFIASGQRFTVGASVAYTQKFEDQVSAEAPVQELAGTFLGPDRVRAMFRAGWTSPERTWGANLLVHASSSYQNLIPTYTIVNPPAGSGSQISERVAGYTTVDLTGTYQYRASGSWFDGLSVTAGARNLFDKAYPFIDLAGTRETVPFDPSRVDLRGRVIFVEIGKKFH